MGFLTRIGLAEAIVIFRTHLGGHVRTCARLPHLGFFAY